MKTIEILVSKSGELHIETHGYTGRDCLAATRQLEAALGAKTSDLLTPDFYRLPVQPPQRLEEKS